MTNDLVANKLEEEFEQRLDALLCYWSNGRLNNSRLICPDGDRVLTEVVKLYREIFSNQTTSTKRYPPINIKNIKFSSLKIVGERTESSQEEVSLGSSEYVPTIFFRDCLFDFVMFQGEASFKFDQYNGIIFENCDIFRIQLEEVTSSFPLKIEGGWIGNISATGQISPWISIKNCALSQLSLDYAIIKNGIGFYGCDIGKGRKVKDTYYGHFWPNVRLIEGRFSKSCDFSGSSFYSFPLIQNCDFSDLVLDGISFVRCQILNLELLKSVRAVRLVAEKQGQIIAANLLYSYELEGRYNLFLKETEPDAVVRFLNVIYKYFSDFGRDYSKPIVWNFLIFFLFLCFYIFPLNGEFSKAFELSLSGALGPFGSFFSLDPDVPSLVEKVCIFQKIISSIVIGLWAIQVRRLFKL